MKISVSLLSFDWQSASLPGSCAESRGDFLLAFSLAFLAASLALDDASAFSKITFATAGVCSC